MDTAEAYRAFFANWPAGMPPSGFVVTLLGETIPFSDFALSASLLILVRDKPDTFGSRKVIVGYDQIAALKLPTPEALTLFEQTGFKQLKS
jgi:hypothetical protein